jgi:ATP-binding cassette subfamily C protein CydC
LDGDFSLEVNDLSFRYPGLHARGDWPDPPPALRHVSFRLPHGKRLAIVGPSGAGKSTLASLLLRFWEYREGQILLGGHDLRCYNQEDLRSRIGVVAQNTHLFNATVRENLLLARPGARQEELVRAAEKAQLHEFILSLPQGYDTWIGEQGLRLSAGERQRLAVARALLKDAPVLILDEPTANLDTITERKALRAMQALMDGRTTLVITHRLVGLEAMDEILVLHRGCVQERGTHDELLEQDGLYRRLWDLQNQNLASSNGSFNRPGL